MSLSKKEIDQIADSLVERVQSTHHSFWIAPEAHYQDHIAMREVIGSWGTAKGIFARVFIALVVLGSIVLALVGFTKGS